MGRNNNSLTNSSNNYNASSQPQATAGTASNRLQFNRLAQERKTVHVMNSGLSKDLKHRQQLLNNFNNGGGGAGAGGIGHLHHQSLAYGGANSNTLQNYTEYGGNQSSLDYTLSGRSQTNTSSFLQKLSSKFIRRYINIK